MSKWIRKGDKVVVIAGNEKGKSGTILSRKGDRVVVQGLNVRKKHVKPKSKVSAGIIDIETPIHISNVRCCDEEGKPLKLKVKLEGTKKRLVYASGQKELIYRDIKKKSE